LPFKALDFFSIYSLGDGILSGLAIPVMKGLEKERLIASSSANNHASISSMGIITHARPFVLEARIFSDKVFLSSVAFALSKS
jgi:hypothetical protein